MNGRRQFIKGFGIFSAVFAGSAVARTQSAVTAVGGSGIPNDNIAIHSEAADPAVVAQLEEQHTSSLALTQTYGEIAPPPPPQPTYVGVDGSTLCFTGSSYITSAMTINQSGNVCINGPRKNYVPGTEKQVDVKMAPGPDGELYLNINGQWKKVLTA